MTTESSQTLPLEKKQRSRAPRSRALHLLLLSVTVLVIYLSSLPGEFVWQDHQDIEGGALRLLSSEDRQRVWSLPLEQYRQRLDGWVDSGAAGDWRPLLALNYSLDWWLWDDCTTCYRMENLFWHLLSVIGLYALGRQVLERRRNGRRTAFWAAALFALHPLDVTVVSWAGGREDLLTAALSIWTLVLFTRLRATVVSSRRRRYWLAGMLVLFILALLSGTNALLVPPAALLLSWFSLRERGRHHLHSLSHERLAGLALLCLLCLPYLLYRFYVVPFDLHSPYPGDGLWEALGSQVTLFWHYVGLVPMPTEPVLSDSWPISGFGPGPVLGLFGGLLLVAATAYGIWLHQPAAFGVAWFLLWLLPGSGLFPLQQYYNESNLYPASWGLLFAITYGAMWLWRPIGRQLARGSEGIVFIPVLLMVGTMTALSNARWWDDQRLFQSEIDLDPYYLNGRIVLAERALQNRQPIDAVNHLLNAVEGSKKPQFTAEWRAGRAYSALSRAEFELALFKDARIHAQQATTLAPNQAQPWYWLGSVDLVLGDIDAAIAALQKARERQTNDPHILARLGAALILSGEIEQGLQLLEPNLAVADGQILETLAIARIEQGDYTAAIGHLENALGEREVATRRARLAWARWLAGDREGAHKDIAQALKDDPAAEYAQDVAARMGYGKETENLEALPASLEGAGLSEGETGGQP